MHVCMLVYCVCMHAFIHVSIVFTITKEINSGNLTAELLPLILLYVAIWLSHSMTQDDQFL